MTCEDLVDLDFEADEATVDMIAKLAAKHAARMLVEHPLYMIEFEWLDETDPLERFTHFGTDPRAMAMPVALPTRREPAANGA